MKKSLRTFFVAAVTIAAFAACTKEAVPGGLNQTEKGRISVSVSAIMGELTPAAGETKSSVESVVRLTWEDTDTVSAYCGSQYLGHLTVSTDEDNKLTAKLSGEIDAPASGTVITLVHSNLTPVVNGSEISVNLDCQKKDSVVNPFVVYGTLESDNQTIENKVVPFKFATSLINVTVTGLDDADVDSVLISGINTVCKLTLNGEGAPTIAGAEADTIAIDDLEQSEDKTRAIFSVGIVKDATATPSRKITAYQGAKRFGSAFTDTEIEESTSYITVCDLKEADGSRGTINGHDYVCIAGTKWATRNIGATADTGEESYGYYFAWADTTGYIYKNSQWVKASDNSTVLPDGFSQDNAPYYQDDTYIKYTETDCVTTLDFSDDAARVKWGGSWRMPTSAEFTAMRAATYWNWEDGGYYVYAPVSGDEGGLNEKKSDNSTAVTGYYNKEDALLFFPAAGDGFGASSPVYYTNGFYWSSSLYVDYISDYGPICAIDLSLSQTIVQDLCYFRFFGISIRPVSD